MLENLYKSVIELSTISLFFIMLYWLRRAVGSIPLYVLLGTFFTFAQITQMPSFDRMATDGESFGMLANGILLIPVIQMYLTIYEEEGTLEAQRFILSMLIAVFGCVYITQMLLGHCQFGASLNDMMAFFTNSKTFLVPMLIMTGIHLLLFMIIPSSYQLLRNMHVPVWLAIMSHIYVFVCSNNTLLVLYHFSNEKIFPVLEWNIAILLISLISHFYLKLTGGIVYERKKPFAMFTTLLGHIQSAGRLRQSVEEWEGRYQTVFDNSMEMIFLVDKHGYLVNANRSAVKLLNRDLNDVDFNLVSLICEEDGKPFDWRKAWADIQINSNDVTGFVTANSHHPNATFYGNKLLCLEDGRTVNVEFNLTSARQNDVYMAVIIMRDTTEQHNEEMKRRKLEEQLMQSQKMEAVGQLAGGIAHDFNNLLLGIQASAEIMDKMELEPKGRAMLDNINSATKRAADLVSKLLGFARKGKYQVHQLNLCTIVQKTADLFSAGLKNVQFKVLLYPEPLMISGDETQLQQSILNLLLNARDALPEEGRRKITLRTDMAHDDMDSWKERPEEMADKNAEDYVTVCVKDTGKGMDDETKERIFEPFYTTKGIKGTGLGMSMVYGCVTHHKGWLHISSTQDVGCEITIFLPKKL